jgi:hypothetical protein
MKQAPFLRLESFLTAGGYGSSETILLSKGVRAFDEVR